MKDFAISDNIGWVLLLISFVSLLVGLIMICNTILNDKSENKDNGYL